jgi:transposase
MGNTDIRTGTLPHRVRPCDAMNSPRHSGVGSRHSCPTGPIMAGRVTRLAIPFRSLMASSGSSIPAPRGAISPTATALGRRSSHPSIVGVRTAPGSGSPVRSWTNSTTEGRSTMTFGVSMAPSFGPAVRRRVRKKNTGSPERLGGPRTAQMQEPSDHALGRSRGGFGTKIHLVCDSHGFIVAIHVTAGQRHESRAFEPTMARRLVHRHRGPRRWPRRLAADKGYSYPGIRRWCRRRRIAATIPTRSNQPREERFDKATYRQRHIIEQVVGWYKEYRALGTRYEKLAVNYVALWLVAIIDKALHRRYPERDT